MKTETIRFLRDQFLRIDIEFRRKLRKQVMTFLETITEDRQKWKAIIKNFLLYVDEANFECKLKIPYKISKLHPTTSVLAVFYLRLPKWLLMEAWTFALSTFKYAEELRKLKINIHPPYIW